MKKWFARASPDGGTLIGPADIIRLNPYFGHQPEGGGEQIVIEPFRD